jgi:hypothetical protein
MNNPQDFGRRAYIPTEGASAAAHDHMSPPFPEALRELGRSRVLRHVTIRGVPGSVLAGNFVLRPASRAGAGN